MINIRLAIEEDDEWKAWVARSQADTRALIEAVERNEKPEVTDLYKKLKGRLLKMFHGKCAYCESLITSQQPGDVDHFRPKGRVTLPDGTIAMVQDHKGKLRPHPGYYWLAYSWPNLLIACASCNRPANTNGKLIGKWDIFPVRGSYAAAPGEEANEDPFLLNPLNPSIDPEQHLKFDSTGVVSATSEYGERCIEILGLNREGLVEARKQAYQLAVYRVGEYVQAVLNARAETKAALEAELSAYREGRAPYSAVGRAVIRKVSEVVR